jgi:bacillopeptidase F
VLVKSHRISAVILFALFCGSPVSAAEIEIAYDDGSAEEGQEVGAVRFTPAQYPVELRRIRFYNWSVESGFNKMWMYDDDGPEGSPGTLLFGPITFLGTPQLKWLEFELPDSLQTVVEQGDFYIAVRPADRDPLAPPLGQDVDGAPQNRSWALDGDTWSQLAPEQGNLMIRVVVDRGAVPVDHTTWGRIKALYDR